MVKRTQEKIGFAMLGAPFVLGLVGALVIGFVKMLVLTAVALLIALYLGVAAWLLSDEEGDC